MPPSLSQDRLGLALRAALAAGILVLLLSGLGRIPLLDPDEGRYARTAQEMLQSGDLVVPRLDGAPRLQKPALFYWLEAAAFTLLGDTETAARLPSALAALGTLLWLYIFARRRAGERAALTACAILATTPLFFALARTATTDMTLTFFVFGATASLYSGVVEPVRSRRDLWIGGICLGLGMLTKGPVVLLVPVLVVAAGAVARRRAPITVAGRMVGVAWIMVLVAVPWAVLLFQRVGWESALEIWRQEALERLGSGLDHPESPLYFLMTSPVTFFPWSAFVPWALAVGIRRARRGDAWWPSLLTWSAGPFLFWTVSRGKLDSYLLPLTPAVALMVACSLAPRSGVGQEPGPGLRWAAWLLAAMAGLALLPYPITRMTRSAPAALPSFALLAAASAAVVALLAWLGRERPDTGEAGPGPAGAGRTGGFPFAAPAGLAALFGAALLAGLLSIPLEVAETRSTRGLVAASGGIPPGETIYTHRVLVPSLGFYTRRVPVDVPARSLLIKLVESGGPATVVFEERRERVARELLALGFDVMARSGGLLLMRRVGPPGPEPAARVPGGPEGRADARDQRAEL